MSKLKDLHWTRRTFAGVAAAGALATKTPAATAAVRDGDGITPVAAGKAGPFWPNSARLAIGISLMFEGGGQPIWGAGDRLQGSASVARTGAAGPNVCGSSGVESLG